MSIGAENRFDGMQAGAIERCLSNHERLSPEYAAFVRDSLLWTGSTAATGAFLEQKMPEFAQRYQYPLQAWPVIVESGLHREMGDIALRLVSLAYSIPARVFDSDSRRLLEHYGCAEAPRMRDAFRAPVGLETAISRTDMVLTREGPKLLEFNMGSNIGGWQVFLLEELYRSEPALAEFAARNGLELECPNALWGLILHCLRAGEAHVKGDSRCVNLAITMRPGLQERNQALMTYFNEGLARRGYPGHVFGYTEASPIEVSGGMLRIEGRPVHAVFNYVRLEQTPLPVLDAFKSGLFALINAPASYVLSSKQSVALLSEWADSGRLPSEECSFVRRHVPWTRHLGATLDFRGDHGDSLSVLAKHQDALVLKPEIGRAHV